MSDASSPGNRAFTVLWDTIADAMGTATTATLFRRAVKRGIEKYPSTLGLSCLSILRDGFDYRYEIPASWIDEQIANEAVCALFRELRPLLFQLTGAVVVRRVLEQPELEHCCDANDAGETP